MMLSGASSYQFATTIQNTMKTSPVFLRVVSGRYKGTIGQVRRVVRHHFERHTYTLDVNTKVHSFCGSKLEETNCVAKLVEDPTYTKAYFDCNDRQIEIGSVIVCACPSRGAGIIIGTVRKINNLGVSISPFMMNGTYEGNQKLVRLARTEGAMIFDRDTMNTVVLQKVAAGVM